MALVLFSYARRAQRLRSILHSAMCILHNVMHKNVSSKTSVLRIIHNVMRILQTVMRKSVSPEHNDLWILQTVM